MSPLPRPLCDFHTHLFPDNFFEAIWRAFDEEYNWNVLYRLHAPKMIEFLRERGTEHIVFLSYAHKPGGVDAFLNEWNRRMLDADPHLYCYAAHFPEGDAAADRERAREVLAHPQVLGIKLHMLVQRIHIDDPRLMPMYEALIESGKTLMAHIGTGPVGHEFTGLAHLRRLLKRFPELPVQIAHMGAMEYEQVPELMREFPQLTLDTAFAFIPYKGMECPLSNETLIEFEDRILFGTDFPNLIFPYETEIDALYARGLPESWYEKVMRENGVRKLNELCDEFNDGHMTR